MLKSSRAVFPFFFFLGKRARKMRTFWLLSLLPVVLSGLVRILTTGRSDEIASVFSDILMVYDLQFLIIILALFFGTSVCSEEIEAKTLPYLTTRPLSKSGIIVGKYAAYAALAALMVFINIFLSFFILNIPRLGRGEAYMELLRTAGVLLLGLMAYTALFTFLGTFLKKSIMIGLFIGFGWESVIQYFPGSTQRFSIVHYLKSLLPYSTPRKSSLPILTLNLEPTPPLTAILLLLVITVFFLALACLLFGVREYMFEE